MRLNSTHSRVKNLIAIFVLLAGLLTALSRLTIRAAASPALETAAATSTGEAFASATPTSYLADSGLVVESELPLWVLMLFFGCLLLLGSIGWPLIIARRRLQEQGEEEKYSKPY